MKRSNQRKVSTEGVGREEMNKGEGKKEIHKCNYQKKQIIKIFPVVQIYLRQILYLQDYTKSKILYCRNLEIK
jgi:hypothetical protein